MPPKKGTFEKEVVDAVIELKREARDAKWRRMKQNKINWDLFHGRGRFEHKQEGQSTEFLPKSALAAEQITAVVKGALMNFDKWMKVEYATSFRDPIFTTHLAQGMSRFYLERANVKTIFSDGIKTGVHESLVTIKVSGVPVVVPRFISPNAKSLRRVDKHEWRLVLSVIPAEDYYPDPHAAGGTPLYEIHSMLMDKHRVVARSRTDENPDGVYDAEIAKNLRSFTEGEVEQRKASNKGEDVFHRRAQRRFPVLLDEFWGTVLDRQGNVMEHPDGFELRNVLLTIANERELIRGPQPNPRWSATSPIVSAPLLRTPSATWPKALMDSAGGLNTTINELFNLMIDGSLSAVYGIKQLKPSYLDPVTREEVSKGIPAGMTLLLNDTAPVGAKALERVDSGEVPRDVLSFFNIVSQLHAESTLSNEIRLGSLPQKQVRATEVVQSGQAISGVFDAITADFEDISVERVAEESWFDILQNVEKFPKDDLARMIGEEGVAELNSLSPKQRFARAANGFKFHGKGLRTITARIRDFQKLVQFLSVVGGNEPMMREFSLRFSMPKLLDKFMRSLEIDSEEIELDEEEIKFRQEMERIEAQARGGAQNAEAPGPGRRAEEPSQPNEQAVPEGTEAGSGGKRSMG